MDNYQALKTLNLRQLRFAQAGITGKNWLHARRSLNLKDQANVVKALALSGDNPLKVIEQEIRNRVINLQMLQTQQRNR